MSDSKIYYNYNKILSYNAFCTLIIKERGYGGTLGMKALGIREFLKKSGKQFVWLRLNDIDCQEVAKDKGKKFFSDVPCVIKDFELLNKADIETDEEKVISAKNEIGGSIIKINGKTAGYIMSLHLFDQFKGTDYANVKWIFLDEFIPANSKRLTYDVAEAFANMVETLARTRPDVRIIACANSIKKSNMLLYKLGFKNINDFGIYKNGKQKDGSPLVVLHYAETNKAYKELHADSNAGRLAKLMGYEGVILNNEFDEDKSLYLDPAKALPFNNVEYIIHTQQDSFRLCRAKDFYFVRSDDNKTAYMRARITFDKMLVNQYVKMGSTSLKSDLHNLAQTKSLRFENEYFKDLFYSIFVTK